MNTANNIDTGETINPIAGAIDPKININVINASNTICPAVILANKRIASTIGFVKTPISSTKGINGIGTLSHQGTPGVLKI